MSDPTVTPTPTDRFAMYTPGAGKWQVIEHKTDVGGEEFFVTIADARDRFEARRIAAAMNAQERAR